jgi:hypothetical protein
MHVPHLLKLFLRQICIIVFHVNSQRLLIIYQEPMNAMKVITEIPFTGKGKIMQPYLIRGNQPNITKTFKLGEKEKTAI